EALAADAAAAEEVMAELQASNELAGSIANTTPSGLTEEEQALYDELEAEAKSGAPSAFELEPETTMPNSLKMPETPRRESVAEPPPIPARTERRRGEAGPG